MKILTTERTEDTEKVSFGFRVEFGSVFTVSSVV